MCICSGDELAISSRPVSGGTVQPYSRGITEMNVHAKEGYLLTSPESAKKKLETIEVFNRYESLDLVVTYDRSCHHPGRPRQGQISWCDELVYLVRQNEKVGYIPAAYLKGAT